MVCLSFCKYAHMLKSSKSEKIASCLRYAYPQKLYLQIFQCDGNFVPETQLSRVDMLSSDDIVPETQRDEVRITMQNYMSFYHDYVPFLV